MSRTTSLLAVGLACCLIEPATAGATHRRAVRQPTAPAWTFQARPLLRTALAHPIVGDRQALPATPSLRFISDRVLVATWVTRGRRPRLQRRDHAAGAYCLHAFFLDAATGRLLRSSVWPAGSPAAAIVWAGGGRFVTARGGALTLREFGRGRPLARAELPGVRWQPFPAPSAPSAHEQFLLLAFAGYRSGFSSFLVDARTLRWVRLETGVHRLSLDSGAVTGVWEENPTFGPGFLVLREPGGRWRRLLRLGQRCGHPRFVRPDLIMVPGCAPRELTLVRLRRRPRPHRLPVGPVCVLGGDSRLVATGGDRVALPVCRLKGSHPLLDIDGREFLSGIDVYDAPFRRRAFALRTLGPALFSPSAFALAPDGSRFAVVSGTSVEVFRLPPQPPGGSLRRSSAGPPEIRSSATHSGPTR